jgi:hypothetical protein
MKTFNDNAGRTWTVAINVDAIKRVKSLLGVNLLDAVEGKLIEQLVSDPVLLCDVLYVLCKPEADTKQVTDEDFGRSMAGDAIDHGTTCLLEELVDFFPQAKRQVLAKALAKLKTFQSKAVETASKRLDDPNLDRRLEALLSQAQLPEIELPALTPGDSSGNSPASSASSPVR